MTYALQAEQRVREASPSRGRSIAGSVGKCIQHVHAAVAEAARVAAEVEFYPQWLDEASSRDALGFESRFERVGWALVATALTEAQISEHSPVSVARALGWFGSEVPAADFRKVEVALDNARHASPNLTSLFPYVLDTFGPTSRLDVMRDGALSDNRRARKAAGSFYTPADVAFFMATSILGDHDKGGERYWFDPACGSGVFLIAALRAEAQACPESDLIAVAAERLLGTDISPQACDFAAFAIVNELAAIGIERPVQLWSDIRQNIIAADALEFAIKGLPAFRRKFPFATGSIRLICNPPYVSGAADLASIPDTRALYIPFLELMWKVASGRSDASAIVAPLAVGANISAEHKRFRAALSENGGTWTMLFFDRQPHAIFGEDAKTRATIALRRPGPAPAEISTSGLLKWTSKLRNSIFTESRSVPLGQVAIARLIPKLGSMEEAELYSRIQQYRLRSADRPKLSKASAGEIAGDVLSTDVFVGGTAYNFLNVFRNYPDNLSWRGELSASGIHKLSFFGRERADAGLAILSSRLAFWLWHVECDGFHVPAWFLSQLPLFDVELPPPDLHELARLGREAWRGLQEDIVVSLNRDKITFAFRPSTIAEIRTAIDTLVLRALGVSATFADTLRAFEYRAVSIDGSARAASPPKSVIFEQRGNYASVG